MKDTAEDPEANKRLSRDESKHVSELARLRVPVVYEIIRVEGCEELERPASSLWWSGIAAGLAISASVFGKAFLHMHLPDEPWRAVVENFGYCLGFLLVIIGRLQLFTENTITAVLPLMAHWTRSELSATARLWSLVFAANMVGAFVSAFLIVHCGLATSEQLDAILEISRHAVDKPAHRTFLHAIPAGFIIAAIVWMLPSAEGNEFFVVVSLTYLIGIGEWSHVIVGAVEAFSLLLAGEIAVWPCVGGFLLPALGGNIIGGTVLFSFLAYAQVKEEM